MKAKPVKLIQDLGFVLCQISEATHVTLNFPGPQGKVTLPVIVGNGTRAGTGCWSWNGDTEKPTLRPSVLSTSGHYTPQFKADDSCWCKYFEEHPEHKSAGVCCYRCHTWVNDGKAQFLSDSTHEHAGKTLDLLEIE
jgi:hypothetical protein